MSWAGEAVGVRWPGSDGALLALIAVIGLAAVGLSRAARPARSDLLAASTAVLALLTGTVLSARRQAPTRG